MTRIATTTRCDFSGCSMFIDGPTKEKGWTIWNGKDLCPDHYVSPVGMMEGTITLYRESRVVTASQPIEFSKIRWCVVHNCPILPDQPDYLDGCVAEGAWWWEDTEKGNDSCVFIDRLIEV